MPGKPPPHNSEELARMKKALDVPLLRKTNRSKEPTKGPEPTPPWLRERGLTREALDRFEVFQYSNPARRSVYNGSVLLKIRRWSDGECVRYLSRNIGEVTPEKLKYHVPANLQKSLEVFGASQLREDHKLPLRVIYVVESPFCVRKFWQLGLPEVRPFG